MEVTISLDAFAQLGIYLALLFLTIYTVMLGYHWFSYGSSKKTSITALTVFIIGNCCLMLGLVLSFNFF